MIVSLFAALAFATEPGDCEQLEDLDRDTVAMAWVSPSGASVGAGAHLPVVPTTDLLCWVHENGADEARVLQALGLRQKPTAPKRPYKVTIFDLPRDLLCRPVDFAEPGTEVSGLAACKKGSKGMLPRYEGCGYTQDAGTGNRAVDLFSVQWKNAASDGFAVIPLSRWLNYVGELSPTQVAERCGQR